MDSLTLEQAKRFIEVKSKAILLFPLGWRNSETSLSIISDHLFLFQKPNYIELAVLQC